MLYCSDAVVSAILLLLQKEPEKKPDYEQVIDRIFERIREKGIFSECDLSLRAGIGCRRYSRRRNYTMTFYVENETDETFSNGENSFP